MDSILQRRTIRKYADRDVDAEVLNRLLEQSMRTQTMGNLQLYSVVVTRNAEMKAQLAPAHFNQPMVTQAPVVLTICADFNRTSAWCRERKAEPGYDNMLSFVNAATDALLFTQTFCNLAEADGLGLCFLGTTLYSPQTIIDVLGLPRLVMPVATLTVGYPAEIPALSDRLPLAAVLHEEKYVGYTSQIIDEYYAPKEALPENVHFVSINKVETLAQVFAHIRYTRKDNESMSAGFMDALRRQGFLD